MRTLRLRLTLTIIAAAVLASAGLAAHHSFAPFNMQGEKTLAGTVIQFDWTNPHTWIWMEVANDKGGVEKWGVEGMSPNYLSRRGWSRTTFKPGDKATIVVHPMRDGSPAGIFVRATLANGRQLTFAATEGAAEQTPAPATPNR